MDHQHVHLCMLLLVIHTLVGRAEEITNWGTEFYTGSIAHKDALGELILVTYEDEVSVLVTFVTSLPHPPPTSLTVERDEPAVLMVPNNPHLVTQSTEKDWKKELKAIRVHSTDNRMFGVRLVTRHSATGSGALTALPNNALGQAYVVTSFTATHIVTQILIIATEEDTLIRMTWNKWSDPPGLKVNGVVPTDDWVDFTLHKSETVHAICKGYCEAIRITSDKNIAVIVGKENTYIVSTSESHTGQIVTQLTPSKYAGRDFFLLSEKAVTHAKAIVQVITKELLPTGSGAACTYFKGRVSPACKHGVRLTGQTSSVLHTITVEPVLAYGGFTGVKDARPSIVPMPSTGQFSTRQVMYMEEGYVYHVIIISTSGDLGGISVTAHGITIKFTGVALCGDSDFNDSDRLQLILKAEAASTKQYQVYNNPVQFEVVGNNPHATERGIVEFRASRWDAPFLLLASELDKATPSAMSTTLPFGLKYIETFDASTCVKTNPAPDDGIDNDCDGHVDEELLDGLDDDGDGIVDDDVQTDIFRNICLINEEVANIKIPPPCAVTVGTSVTYECEDGYELQSGHISRVCLTDLTLAGTKPVCTDDVTR